MFEFVCSFLEQISPFCGQTELKTSLKGIYDSKLISYLVTVKWIVCF